MIYRTNKIEHFTPLSPLSRSIRILLNRPGEIMIKDAFNHRLISTFLRLCKNLRPNFYERNWVAISQYWPMPLYSDYSGQQVYFLPPSFMFFPWKKTTSRHVTGSRARWETTPFGLVYTGLFADNYTRWRNVNLCVFFPCYSFV